MKNNSDNTPTVLRDEATIRKVSMATGLSIRRTKQLLEFTKKHISADSPEFQVACLFAKRAGMIQPRYALGLAYWAMKIPELKKLILRYWRLYQQVAKLVQKQDDQRLKYFIEVFFFGNWRRDIRHKYGDVTEEMFGGEDR